MTMTMMELTAYLNEQIKTKKATAPAPVVEVKKEVKVDVVENAKPAYTVEQTTEPVIPEVKPKKLKITPTSAQDVIIKDIKRWYFTKKGYAKYELGGFAGVGKSTVVDIVLDILNVRPEHVRMCAPTGQASLVLKEKTPNYSSSTIHSLFFVAELTKAGVRFVPSGKKIAGVKLIIMDESSMVGKKMAEQILPIIKKAGAKLLVIGDPGQLPPVKDEDYFFKEPDAMLTEVMRQAADNPIISLSMKIRQATEEGHAYRFPAGNHTYGGKVFLRNRNSISVDQYAKVVANGGIILAGTNKTRKALNIGIREKLGFDAPTLLNGEKVIIKENLQADEDEGIQVTNGMTGTVSNVKELPHNIIEFTFTPDNFDGSRIIEVNADVLFERKTMSQLRKEYSKTNYLRRSRGEATIPLGTEVLFGYCITVHASQGSQWRVVYLIDESYCFNRDSEGYKIQNRWLYTAVTRAVESLVVAI